MAMDADVRLLIGVARGGADGDSEALIRKELNEIMGKIKLEAKLDSKSFGEQIRKQLDAISKNGKFYVNLSKINIGAGAIADFRRQLNTVINTLNLDKGTSITLTAEGIGEVKSKIKETATVTDEAARKMAEFNVQIAAMKKQSKNIDTGLGSLSKGATAEEAAQVTALLERYKAWQVEFETLRLQGVDGSNERRKALEDEAAAILVNIQRINEEREATAEAAQAKVQAEREAKAADDATVTAENRKNAAMKQGVMLLTQMQKAEQDWTAAQSGRSSEHYNNIRQGTVYLQEYLGQLERGEISVDEFQRRLAGLRTSFAESSNAIKSAGENTKTLSERVGGLAAKFTSWLTVSQIVMKLYSSLKKMVSAVIDIDTAMTELKKVTDETSTVYAKYLDDASVRAKKLGATIADTVTASADFARLGYTLDEAAQLADAALVYKNVGDGIEDVSQASESIISTMKAFGIEAENAISIVDKFNEVGNNFAISSEGVGEALRRSASALAAGNNTLDESIALITAANSVVQDADVVGTTMKTVSMYLRAAKTEAEEAGESTEGMANSVSELREELLALTNGKVDIQIDENTFKSTYQIMKELADVWGELTDITQANILEQIGGKRNANVVSSMLENFNVAEDVVKTAANSAGSALKENEKYLDSINGKIAEFKATFEELSMTLIDSDFVKQVIEFGTGLLDVLNVLAKVIDKVGGLNTVLYVTVGILATIKADAIKTFLVTTIPSALAKVTSAVSTFVTGFKQLPAVIKAMNSQTALAIPGTSRLSVALKTLGISASTAQIAVAGIAAAIGAILLIKNAIEDARTKRIEEAASTIASTEATIENADAVKAAYIEYEKYANRTDLTESEEASFKTALDKVTSALGDKAVALEGLTQGTKDYTEALDGAIKKELEEAQLAAKEKRVAAEKKLQSETWSGWDGSKISYNIQDAWTDEEYVKAKEAAQKIASDYLREKVSSVGYGLAATELVLEPVDWNVDHSNMDAVVDYYYTLLDLKAELLRQDLTGNEIYDAVIEKTGLLKDSVDTYVQSIYDETSATYVLQNGIPTTVEELEKFRTYLNQTIGDMFNFDDGSDSLSDLINGWLSDSGYTSALNNFSRISNTINSVSDSFQTLANLQNQVADGFTMSLDKALEFASVYPEILNNATVAADGQLTLNADVVNSFIAGKKAELDAQIDSQITQLEADKAVLTAKMESAQAQLELAKNVGDGEGQIAKEVAEYRINTGNALTAALIEMGVEESKAYALAAAAMAGNEEEFARVAKECFENMDDNAAKAAYNMAHSIFVNASNSCNSISEIAAQAHETAQAIAAMGSGEVAGSSSSIFGGTDGTQTGGLSLDLYKGNFKGTDYNYEATSVSLDDYVSQLELDISSYEKAIAQIDGQIAALQALKNAPLKSFESSSGSSGSGGSSKEVEEYLADIDEYYEAMKRLESIQQRLAKLQSQIEYADTEEEKIALTKQLINVYNDEADALENLNSLRSETIANGKAELEALGFSVSYDATTNEFMVHNMEHLNELYGATQEETNELRKKTEELIDTMESLNDSNQEGASSLRTLKADIKSAKQSIIDYLKQIVTAASDVVDAYQNVYETLHNAADEYAANGYITIDTLQSIIELGAQYMQYLMDENGLLVINEENINKVLAAKTQELALNQAMTYVERLRLALQENSIEDLNNLLYATTEATNATWGLVYANLALLGLDDDQYQAALHNINAIRSLADSAVSGIGQTAGKTAEELNNMKDGLDDILKYVMDMLKQRINDQIDALEDMKDAYADIISLRKEALEAAKSEADYQDKVAEKVKALAKLQARINALSLDDSRDAQAQKAKLEEEMSQLQKELADTQSDYAVDAQKSALDNMQKAYEEQKNAEIKVLEDSISSYQKLYDMAIAYIQSNWGSLYDELIAWNYQYGDELSSTITTAWENALAAAQRYGSYVNALNSIGADIDAANGAGSNYIVGETTYDNSSSNEEMIHAIIKEMYANSQAHHTASKEEKARLDKRNLTLGAMLGQYGVNAYRQNGTWYVDGGALLYEKYRKYIYHTGGIAGDQPTLKQNEILAVLEKGEAVLDAKKEAGLYRIIDFTTALSDKLSKLLTLTDMSRMFGQMQGDVTKAASAFAPINNTQTPSVSFGDVIIYGANEETVEKHREINRQFTNDVIKQLNIKR